MACSGRWQGKLEGLEKFRAAGAESPLAGTHTAVVPNPLSSCRSVIVQR